MHTFVGKIVCKKIALGSKSEFDAYFLEMDNGDHKRIVVKKENHFEQPTLKGLVGKHCQATGVQHNNMLIADTVKEV